MPGGGSFEQFKAAFTEDGDFYSPKDPSDNIYRHFGTKCGKRLLLSHDELLYIYSRSPPAGAALQTKAYFELKNSDLNILAEGAGHTPLIYSKTKHFRRDKALPLAALKYHGRDECLSTVSSDTVVGVLGTDTFCFVRLQPVGELSLETPSDLRKWPDNRGRPWLDRQV